MTATACFITRNHAACLASAIQSVQAVAAQIVVVDTGSTDETVAIAQKLGAEVVPFTWTNDFAAACNRALETATHDWILWMNPDESLNPRGLDAVKQAMTQTNVLAYELRVQQELSPDRPAFGTANWQPRLFQRRDEIRYQGRIHPKFVTPLLTLAPRLGLEIKQLDVTIHRYAYLSVPTPDKIRWSVQLLEAELRDRPAQLDLQIELGRNLLLLDDPAGHQVLADAAEVVRTMFESNTVPPAAVGSLLEYLLTVSPEQSRSSVKREESLIWAERWCQNSPPVLWAIATERFAADDFPRAAFALNRLLEMGRTHQYDTREGFDPDILGRSALMNLGICQLQMRHWNEARTSLRKLLPDAAHRDRSARLLELIDTEEAKSAKSES